MRLFTSLASLASGSMLAVEITTGRSWVAHWMPPSWQVLHGDGSARMAASQSFYDNFSVYDDDGAGRLLYEEGLAEFELGR